MKRFITYIIILAFVFNICSATYANDYDTVEVDSVARTITAYNDYVYVAGDNGISVIDYSNAENPIKYITGFSDEQMNDSYSGYEHEAKISNKVYASHGYLFAQSGADRSKINCFDISSTPTDPDYIKTFSNDGIYGYIAKIIYDGTYLYVLSDGDISAFNFSTGSRIYRTSIGSIISMAEKADYLVATKNIDNKQNLIVIRKSDGVQVSAVSAKMGTGTGVGDNCFGDVIVVENTAFFIVKDPSVASKRNFLAAVNVENPLTIDSQTVYYCTQDNATVQFQQINQLSYARGLLYISDREKNVVTVIDVSNPTLPEKLEELRFPGWFNIVMTDELIHVTNETKYIYSMSHYQPEITCNTPSPTDVPIIFRGKALGRQGEASVKINNIEKVGQIEDNGTFELSVDDEFIPNGEYTALITVGQQTKNVEVNINHNDRISVIEDEQNLTITNNRSSDEIIRILRAGYKNGALFDLYDSGEQLLETGNPVVLHDVSTSSECDRSVTFVVKKKNDSWVYVWNGNPSGTAQVVSPEVLIQGNESIAIEANCNHSEMTVDIGIKAPNLVQNVFVMVENPNGNIEYVDASGIENNYAGFRFVLQSPTIEDEDYVVSITVPSTNEYVTKTKYFRYYGDSVINPILESLDNEEDIDLYFDIISQNKDKLGIDLTEYNNLPNEQDDTYRATVITEVMKNDYYQQGITALKNAWNAAVTEQISQMKIDNALEAINSINSFSDFVNLFDNHFEIVGINLSEHVVYSELDSGDKQKIYPMLDIGNYNLVSDFLTDFEINTALVLINSSDEESVAEHLELTKDTLCFNYSSNFEEFTQMQKAQFYKSLCEKDYNTKDELVTEIARLIDLIAAGIDLVEFSFDTTYKAYADSSNRAFWSVTQYKGYVYTMYTGGLRIIDFNQDTPVDVTPDNADLYPGTTSTDYVNRYAYVYDGYLYMTVQEDNILRKFSLTDPANPQKVAEYSLFGGRVLFIEVDKNNIYVASDSCVSIFNNATNNSYKIEKGYSAIRVRNNKLYGVTGGTFDIYDVSNLNSIQLLGSKSSYYTDNNGNTKNRMFYDVEVVGDYAIITESKGFENWNNRDFWIIDISNPANIANRSYISYAGGENMTRIGSMQLRNGILFVADVENRIYAYDVSNMPQMEEIAVMNINDYNPLSISVSEEDVYVMAYNYNLIKVGYKLDAVKVNADTVTSGPIIVSGSALGHNTVSVTLNGITKTVNTNDLGNFVAEFDDDFIPNGVYTANASGIGGTASQGTGSITVSIPQKYFINSSYQNYCDTLDITNIAQSFDAVHITAGYKDNELSYYDYNEITIGSSSQSTNTILNDTYSYVKTYLLKKTDDGPILVYEKVLDGTRSLQSTTLEENQDYLSLKCDVLNELKTVDASAKGDFENVLFIAYAQNNGFDNIEYIETMSPNSKINFVLKNPQDSMQYSGYIGAKGKDNYYYDSVPFTYYSDSTIIPILEMIRDSSIGTIEGILSNNSDKLAIELGADSDYSKLADDNGYYQNKVLNAVMKDYIQNGGSVELKRDFETAVDTQSIEKKFYEQGCNTFAAINAATDYLELENALSQDLALGIDVTQGIYSKLSVDRKVKVFEKLNANTYTPTKDDVRQLAKTFVQSFNEYSAIEYINESAFDSLGTVFQEIGAVIPVVFGSDFEGMNSTNKLNVYKEFSTKKDFSNVTEIQTAINEAIAYVKKNFKQDTHNPSSPDSTPSTKPNSPIVIPSEEVQQSPQSAISFADLTGYDWAKKQIEYLSSKGIINGKGNNIYAPSDSITRQEFVKLVVLAFGYKPESKITFGFTDVDTLGWSAPYIQSAVENKIILGESDHTFAPEKIIKREDMAVILHRVMEANGVEFNNKSAKEFADEESISQYAKEAVSELAAVGIINGVGNDLFAPLNSTDRASAAVMIYSCMNYIGKIS